MVFKLVALACLVVVTNAGLIPSGSLEFGAVGYAQPGHLAYAAPVASKAVIVKSVNDYDPNPEYSYSYEVHDALTGDAKSQQETRKGDVVEGSYSFIEADGTRRLVHYTADDQNGFNAVVEKQPAEVAVKTLTPLKTIAPTVSYAPAKPLAYKVGAIAHPTTAYDRFAPVAYFSPLYHH